MVEPCIAALAGELRSFKVERAVVWRARKLSLADVMRLPCDAGFVDLLAAGHVDKHRGGCAEAAVDVANYDVGMKLPPLSLIVVVTLTAAASWAWRSHVKAQDGALLAQRVQPGDIRMISSETCGWCTAARRWMQDEGIAFQECFIERDAQCRADYQALGSRGTPTLVVRGQTVLGLDRARIIEIVR